MYSIYRMKIDELSDDFLTSLRALFKGKTIEIAVSEAEDDAEDETAYLLKEPANRQRLMDAIANVGTGGVVQVDLDGKQ